LHRFALTRRHGCDGLFARIHQDAAAIDGIIIRFIPHVPEDASEASLAEKVKEIGAYLGY
jgi:hypothetical protein